MVSLPPGQQMSVQQAFLYTRPTAEPAPGYEWAMNVDDPNNPR
jgi:hypothetical protein